MHNGNIISICICIKERLKQLVNNYIFLVPNAFHHIKASTFKVFKRKKSISQKLTQDFRQGKKYTLLNLIIKIGPEVVKSRDRYTWK